tara:strand:- start:1449 stop:1829 length:381 start_codon:yes stop_codon:yes gene_type:complete
MRPPITDNAALNSWLTEATRNIFLLEQKQNSSKLGEDQRWQTLTTSRSKGTLYKNDTGKPIMICVTASGNAGARFRIVVNDVKVVTPQIHANTYYNSAEIIIPNDANYKMEDDSGTTTLQLWAELR